MPYSSISIPAYFAITSGCNLSCKYCYVPKVVKKQDNLFIQEFKNLVDKMAKESIRFSSCTFHGVEPTILTGDSFKSMIDYYRDTTGHNLKFRMQTNGIDLNGLMDCVSPDEVSVGVSLDGYEENHDNLRGKGSWAKSYQNLITLKEAGYDVGVMTVLNCSMVNHKKDLISFSNSLADLKIDLQMKVLHTNELTEELSLFNQKGYELGGFIYTSGLHKHTQFNNTSMCMSQGNNCRWFQFNADGLVYACNKYFTPSQAFGNWKTDTLKNIIVKRGTLLHNEYINPECYTCPYWSVCQAGCPADRVEGKSLECYFKRGAFDAAGGTLFSVQENLLNLKGFHDEKIS